MAKIFPFRALRYDPDRVSISDVVTQPYDKITPEMQERYYRTSPHNLVRIILGKPQPGDNDKNNVYTRAAQCFRQWRSEGILRQDAEPAIYAYSQQFSLPAVLGKTYERRGFIALGQLEPYDTGIVHRHEQTHSAPKTDRLNLLRATQAHFGQIFMLYNDPAGEIDDALVKISRYAPNVEVCDEYNVRHRLWLIPGMADLIGRKMVDKKLIIADGHHRYETALNYQAERRQQAGNCVADDAPFNRVMMTFINLYGEGVVILPTHRVISGLDGFDSSKFRKQAGEFFEIVDAPADLDGRQAIELLQDEGQKGTAMLAITASRKFLLRARPGAGDVLLADLPLRQRELDVVLLHKALLEYVLGISEQQVREQKHVSYLRSAEEAIQHVRDGANIVFLMNPVRIDQVRDIAFAGEVLPQKSTDFYPKLLSGLTIYALE